MSDSYLRFIDEAKVISNDYPQLRYEVGDNGVCHVAGSIQIRDSEGGIVDSYSIKITHVEGFPLRFPYVYELGGRLPHNIDWHVYPNDGQCCICSTPREIYLCRKGISLKEFVYSQVVPYFYNQNHREREGYFVNECEHGTKGNLEFLEELFHTTDIDTIISYLNHIRDKKEPKPTAKCLCGSRRKFKKCHRRAYRMIKFFKTADVSWLIEQFTRYKELRTVSRKMST